MKEGLLEKRGGPIGYNYALKTQLEKMGVKNIEYIPSPKRNKKKSKRSNIRTTWYGKILKLIRDFCRTFWELYGKSKKAEVDLNQYDVVHFHSTKEMFLVKDSLKDYKGTVILTTHSPEVYYKELIELLVPWAQKHMLWFFNKMELFDIYAFRRADYIFFPCPEAEEPYFHTWPKFEEIKRTNKEKFKYLLTGVSCGVAQLSREKVLEKYGIPQDAFVICFVGRHNTIKGYDIVKEISQRIFDKHSNVYFLIAGVEYPLTGVNHQNWIEAGWTNDPHSIIKASNLYLMPNRETYFDLAFLEVLSLGKILVASKTGGNKYFTKDKTDGVFLFSKPDEALNIIENLLSKGDEELKLLEKHNFELYNKEFTLDVFAKNYVNLVGSL